MGERRSGLISMSLHQELPASYRPGGSDGDQEFESPFLQERVHCEIDRIGRDYCRMVEQAIEHRCGQHRVAGKGRVKAARAILPIVLSDLTEYATTCIKTLYALWQFLRPTVL
jgi:hypothetical protein